jgi:hypothetical protein
VKANAWQAFFQQQRDQHDKVLFTVTELAHVAGISPAALNVELARLRQRAVVVKYAHGLYGLPGAVSVEALLPAIDPHAYITAHYALYTHHLVTQTPTVITCFTDRRSPRSRERSTPVGRLEFVCVRSGVYAPPLDRPVAPPSQALCDYVYLSRRQRVRPENLVTFRQLHRLDAAEMATVLPRYPQTVQRHVEQIRGTVPRNVSP